MGVSKIFITVFLLGTGVAKAQFSKAQLQISGLNCALCAKATETSLRALPFIGDVKPDLMHNIYNITFKNDQRVNFDQIGQIVKKQNFFVSSLKATFNFDNVKVVNNYFNYNGDTYQVVNGAGKTLSGPVEVTIVDKGLAPRWVSKKYLTPIALTEPAKTGRLYHIAI